MNKLTTLTTRALGAPTIALVVGCAAADGNLYDDDYNHFVAENSASEASNTRDNNTDDSRAADSDTEAVLTEKNNSTACYDAGSSTATQGTAQGCWDDSFTQMSCADYTHEIVGRFGDACPYLHLTNPRTTSNVRTRFDNGENPTIVHIRKHRDQAYALDGNHGGAPRQSVYLWSQNSGNINQKWQMHTTASLNGIPFNVMFRKLNTKYCIDGGGGGAPRQDVYLWECDEGNNNQVWRLHRYDSGAKYRLVKVSDSLQWGMDGNSVPSTDGKNVHLWHEDDTNLNQYWVINEL